jgi:hypothetical protein
MDWAAWSRETVLLMAARTRELLDRHAIPMGSAYRWDLDAGRIVVGGVTFRLTVVGTAVGDSFLWAWANDAIPEPAKADLQRVRQFGVEHDLGLLAEECARGGVAQAKECVAIAGRVLDAQGTWLSETADGHMVFVLHELPHGPD